MNWLYVFAESDADALFYHALAEKITGLNFQENYQPIINSPGEGIDMVWRFARLVLKNVKCHAEGDKVFFIISVDNDRAPDPVSSKRPKGNFHPNDLARSKENRREKLLSMASEILGGNRAAWSAKGAFAVPVEMLEAWALMICKPTLKQEELPLFAKADRLEAKFHYGDRPVPPQLKDQFNQLLEETPGATKQEFLLGLALSAKLPDLAARSSSFKIFSEDLEGWCEAEP